MVNFEWDPVRAKEVAYEEGDAAATKRVTNEIALSLLQNKIPIKLITKSTHLSIEEVTQLAKDHQLAI